MSCMLGIEMKETEWQVGQINLSFMTTFNEYWKEKSQKRRKSWAAKAKRHAESHMQLEDIRKEVYLPLDYAANFNLEDYKYLHFIKHNPFIIWHKGAFSFDKEGLRKAMKAEGANLNELTIEMSRQSIRETEVPQPVLHDKPGWTPNKVYDFEEKYHAWLKRVYDICTDKETVKLTYGEVSMTINRYSLEGEPFGFYELNPCEQLTKAPILMQETDISFLNIASLLMESAAEWQLRREELNFYAKKLRLRTMDAVLTDTINFELWDDKKLEKKVAEYISKDYPVEKILEQVLRPWKQAITKYFQSITEQEIQIPTEKFDAFRRYDLSLYIKNVLQPYFSQQGLQDIKVWTPNNKSSFLFMENHGHQLKHNVYNNCFYPNAHYPMCHIDGVLNGSPLRSLAVYLQMDEINNKTDEVVIKVMHLYDQQMQQKLESYRQNVDILDTLAIQHTGTAVGKMMKYLRWNAGRFINQKDKTISISTIKVLGETSFSYMVKNEPQGMSISQGQLVGIYKDIEYERWLDADCQTVYASDPETTDLNEWEKTHRQGMFVDRWSWSVQEFLNKYSPQNSKPSLSINFIEQNL